MPLVVPRRPEPEPTHTPLATPPKRHLARQERDGRCGVGHQQRSSLYPYLRACALTLVAQAGERANAPSATAPIRQTSTGSWVCLHWVAVRSAQPTRSAKTWGIQRKREPASDKRAPEGIAGLAVRRDEGAEASVPTQDGDLRDDTSLGGVCLPEVLGSSTVCIRLLNGQSLTPTLLLHQQPPRRREKRLRPTNESVLVVGIPDR
jgi:hypothetical protein